MIKLQHHLSILREEYVKLQHRLLEAERKAEMLAVSTGNIENLSESSFVVKLVKTVARLFEEDLYRYHSMRLRSLTLAFNTFINFSDITVLLNGHQLRAHRFVLAARSDDWGVPDLSSADKLEFKGCSILIFLYFYNIYLRYVI